MKKLLIILFVLFLGCSKEEQEQEYCSTCTEVDQMGFAIDYEYFCGTLEEVERFEMYKLNSQGRWYCGH
jgi:hypothetical protein